LAFGIDTGDQIPERHTAAGSNILQPLAADEAQPLLPLVARTLSPTFAFKSTPERIKNLPSVRELYARTLVEAGAITQEETDREAAEAYQRLVDIQQSFKSSMARPSPKEHSVRLSGPGQEVDTALAPEFLVALNDQLLSWPRGFTVNSKLRKQLERRRAALGQ
jgi:2-oxoglutarate dehydrogenase E1 component